MSSTEEEVGNTSPFAGSVTSDERKLAIDDDILESSLVPRSNLDTDSNVVVRKGEDCVRRALEEIADSDSQAEDVSEGDIFVDIMGSLENKTGSKSEGFTFADILQRADLLSETVLERVVDTPD